MRKQIKKHFSITQLIGALIGAGFIFLVTTPMIIVGEHLQEMTLDQESYFEYIAVRPVKDSFKQGETLAFNSFIEYHREISIRWEDTLYCFQDNGVKKYDTQFWPEEGFELQKPGIVNLNLKPGAPLTFWEYTASKIDPEATDCYMIGSIVGKTKHGYQKIDYYITETFSVNE